MSTFSSLRSKVPPPPLDTAPVCAWSRRRWALGKQQRAMTHIIFYVSYARSLWLTLVATPKTQTSDMLALVLSHPASSKVDTMSSRFVFLAHKYIFFLALLSLFPPTLTTTFSCYIHVYFYLRTGVGRRGKTPTSPWSRQSTISSSSPSATGKIRRFGR